MKIFPGTKEVCCPGQAAYLVRALSVYAKVVGSIPVQGMYKKQARNAWMGGQTN